MVSLVELSEVTEVLFCDNKLYRYNDLILYYRILSPLSSIVKCV